VLPFSRGKDISIHWRNRESREPVCLVSIQGWRVRERGRNSKSIVGDGLTVNETEKDERDEI